MMQTSESDPMSESKSDHDSEQNWQTLVPRPSPDFPRRYLPTTLNLSSWENLEPYLKELENRPLADKAALLGWIRDFSEFSDAVGEESARLYIEMTRFTQDSERERAYLHFVEEIEPKLAPIQDRLHRKIVSHPEFPGLPSEAYAKWMESLKTSIELFHEANVSLHTEITKLSQQYQKVCGEMTVIWEGKTRTLSQMAPLLQEGDRSLRERAWTAMAQRRLKEQGNLEEIFDQLLDLRNRVSDNLGLVDFREYSFKHTLRTDYSPSDCEQFHATVESTVVPIYRKVLAYRQERLGLENLRPWDLSCDVLGRPPLKPFHETAHLIEGVGRIFTKLDPELSGFYKIMESRQLLDLENRVGKAPGGYQSSLPEVRLPFIFMNAVGLNDDIFTLLHESGHAFHQFYTRPLEPGFNRSAPMEFSEVASMAMERMGAKYLEEFYGDEERRRAIQGENEEVFRILPWVATVDAFQHWIYTHRGHSQADRRTFWLDLDRRFGPPLDWSGLEEFRAISWHRQLHIFEVPFYYIEYAIAQLGALQVWMHSLQDEKAALELYKKGLKLGGTCGLRELFAATGLRFDMSEETIKPLVERVWEEWEKTI